MAQSTILAAAQTAGTSTEIVVADGETVIVGIFASSDIPNGVALSLHIATPGRNGFVQKLTNDFHHAQIPGPASYYVNRPDISAHGVNVGVFLNT